MDYKHLAKLLLHLSSQYSLAQIKAEMNKQHNKREYYRAQGDMSILQKKLATLLEKMHTSMDAPNEPGTD